MSSANPKTVEQAIDAVRNYLALPPEKRTYDNAPTFTAEAFLDLAERLVALEQGA